MRHGLLLTVSKHAAWLWSYSRQVHGDVFRPPRFLEVLAALVGTGVQLALLVLSVILITIAGEQGVRRAGDEAPCALPAAAGWAA